MLMMACSCIIVLLSFFFFSEVLYKRKKKSSIFVVFMVIIICLAYIFFFFPTRLAPSCRSPVPPVFFSPFHWCFSTQSEPLTNTLDDEICDSFFFFYLVFEHYQVLFFPPWM